MKKMFVVVILLVGIALLLYAIDKYDKNSYSTWSQDVVSSMSATGAGVSWAIYIPHAQGER